jgi:hypothetical protein
MKLLELGEVGTDKDILQAGQIPLRVDLFGEGVRQMKLLQILKIREDPNKTGQLKF